MSEQPMKAWSSLVLRRDVLDPIIREAAANHGVRPAEVLSDSRRRAPSRARQEAIYRLREIRRPNGERAYSLEEIGRRLNRDHTTIRTAIIAHKARTL